MNKLQSGDEIVKVDENLGIAWILLPPDESMGGFRGISPRVLDETKFLAAKRRAEERKREMETPNIRVAAGQRVAGNGKKG